MFTDITDYGVSLLNKIRDNASARLDWQWGRRTLSPSVRLLNESEHATSNVGSMPRLPRESNTDHTIQASDSFVINNHAVNETRLQFE
jgi:hypothetical protein